MTATLRKLFTVLCLVLHFIAPLGLLVTKGGTQKVENSTLQTGLMEFPPPRQRSGTEHMSLRVGCSFPDNILPSERLVKQPGSRNSSSIRPEFQWVPRGRQPQDTDVVGVAYPF